MTENSGTIKESVNQRRRTQEEIDEINRIEMNSPFLKSSSLHADYVFHAVQKMDHRNQQAAAFRNLPTPTKPEPSRLEIAKDILARRAQDRLFLVHSRHPDKDEVIASIPTLEHEVTLAYMAADAPISASKESK